MSIYAELLALLRQSCPEVTLGGKSPDWIYYPHIGQPFNWSCIPACCKSDKEALLVALEFYNWFGEQLALKAGETWEPLTPRGSL